MGDVAISVHDVWKSFRRYREKNQFLKAAILKGRRGRYDEFWALKEVGFEVPVGTTFGIIGRNGSGKSTLLKCLAGILYPEQGSIATEGRLAPLLELGAGFHPELSGRENIFLNAAILGMPRADVRRRYDEIVDFAGVEKFIDSPLKSYSSGMYIRLAFSVAISVDPEIMMIDEVLAVGDTEFQRKCGEKIEQFRRDGKTIVLVSHGLGQVEQLCDTTLWLESGETKKIGETADVVAAYIADGHLAETSDPSKNSVRWGGGEVEIGELVTKISESTESAVIQTGQSLFVDIPLLTKADLESLVLTIRLNNDHGQEIWSTSSRHHGLKIESSRSHQIVRIHFPNFNLLEGRYSLSVTATDKTEQLEYDHIERASCFRVDQHGIFETGLVHFDSRWTTA